MAQRHIFLIGGRASGKTSVAKVLAAKLGVAWVDTDELLQERVGESIASLVERKGWDVFRDQETETLQAVCAMKPLVVACGGGIILREENWELLHQGMIFYLKVDPDLLAARLAGDSNEAQRPTLTGKSLLDEVREVMGEREPLYTGCADHVLDGALSLEEVAATILGILKA